MIKAFIVDDEPKAVDTLGSALNTFFDNVEIIGKAHSIESAYTQLGSSMPDLLFLDVNMGGESGFQLLEKLGQVGFHVVFVTAHEEYALKAIKFSALDYIIKPASISDLKGVLHKVESRPVHYGENMRVQQMFGNLTTEDKSEHKITLPISEGFEFVKVGRVKYITAEGNYSTFHLKSGSQKIASRNLKYYESLLFSYGFYRIHNSVLVNLSYLRKVSRSAGGTVIMEDGMEFGISRSRKPDFLNFLELK